MVFGFLAVSGTVSRNARCRSGAAQSLDISHVFYLISPCIWPVHTLKS
jgi:hypothetical protein